MKRILFLILPITLIVFFYAVTIRGSLGNYTTPSELSKLTTATKPFESSHERATFAQAIAIIDFHRFDLPQKLADFGAPDVGYMKNKFFSYFPPGATFSIIPMYLVGYTLHANVLFAFITPIFFALGSLLFMFLIARNVLKLSVSAALFSCLAFAFATTAWGYSITIYQHIYSVFFAVGIFYSVFMFSKHSKFHLEWATTAWLLYGLSIYFDYPNGIVFLPLMVYFFLSSIYVQRVVKKINVGLHPTSVIGSIAFVVVIGLFGLYNQVTYGNFRTLSNHMPRYEITNLAKAQQVEKTADLSNVSGVFMEERVVSGLYELLIAPDKGIFIYCPILLLSLGGIFLIRKKITLPVGTLLAVIITNIILYASFSDPWGGWAYGPRYLVPSMALLALFVGVFVDRFPKVVIAKIIAFALFAVSSTLALLGVLTTNAVPPKIEAVYLKMKYGVPFVWDYMQKNTTGNFVYHQFFDHKLTLLQYFVSLEILLLLFVAIVLFVLPRFTKNEA